MSLGDLIGSSQPMLMLLLPILLDILKSDVGEAIKEEIMASMADEVSRD